MNNSYITIIKEKRTALSRKRIPLNKNGCTANFRIGVPFEQNLQFRVVFEMTDGSLMEFQMQQGDFRELEKGDRGMLTYQGNRYICYQKYKFKSEAQEEEKC